MSVTLAPSNSIAVSDAISGQGLTEAICDLYGLVVACRADCPGLAADLMRPFRYFERQDGNPGVTIVVEQTDPPYGTFPPLTASFSTPRNIVYRNGSCKIVDYFGKGVVVEEPALNSYRVYSRDENFLRETIYLLTTALLGQHCDRSGMLRVHALALSYRDTAVLLPMPPEGGKSTLALAMLEQDGFDAEYWKDRLERRRLRDTILFISERILNGEPSIRVASKREALASLIRDAVIGVGLYQGLEFLLSNSMWEVVSRMGVVSHRFYQATRLALASRTYHASLSRDVGKNARLLTEFIHRTVGA